VPLASLLTASENHSLSSANNISARFKIYLQAADRHLDAASKAESKEEVSLMSKELSFYRQILGICQDELASLEKRKRKDFKRHEITLRKFISTLNSMEARADLDQRDLIAEAIKATKQLRAGLLDTFFGSEVLKKP
jgi:hypothetical protein